MPLPEYQPHINSTRLLEIKYQKLSINMDINGIKILRYPLSGSQGRAGASPSRLQARGRVRPGQVNHRRGNRQSIIHTLIQGQSPIQTWGRTCKFHCGFLGIQKWRNSCSEVTAWCPNDILIRNKNNKG